MDEDRASKTQAIVLSVFWWWRLSGEAEVIRALSESRELWLQNTPITPIESKYTKQIDANNIN